MPKNSNKVPKAYKSNITLPDTVKQTDKSLPYNTILYNVDQILN